jgi:cyclin-dependent kinase|mmetsp:Transcript_6957/g.21975  ORF Transcript_6957/g.21975 Transcript_6957/m.21975 type:complete len:122 (-) Transcript_6957:256-621(-)
MGSRTYSTPVDIWSVGCIFAEMATSKPLFAGTSEADQLKRIFKTLGSPTQQAYPALVELPDYTNELDAMGYPPPSSLTDVTPHIDHAGINLLSQMLTYDPLQRCSAADAMKHEYFKTHHAG